MRCFTHTGNVVYQLGMRLSDHRITRASPFTVHHGNSKVAESVLSFRIAIWNRNVIVSTIAVSSLLAGLGLNIRCASFRTMCAHDDDSRPFFFVLVALTMVRV